MNITDIEREQNRVEKLAVSNSDTRDLVACATRGLWEIALQLAKGNQIAEHKRSAE